MEPNLIIRFVRELMFCVILVEKYAKLMRKIITIKLHFNDDTFNLFNGNPHAKIEILKNNDSNIGDILDASDYNEKDCDISEGEIQLLVDAEDDVRNPV